MSRYRNSNKELIRKVCLEVIESPDSKLRERLQAASMLEKLVRFKALASKAKNKSTYKKRINDDTMGRIDDLLGRIAN